MTSFNKFYDMVLFHYPCQDGLSAAWVVTNYHRENNRTIELYPISHGKSIDINMLKNKKIIMCDYSPQIDVLEQIEQALATKITFLTSGSETIFDGDDIHSDKIDFNKEVVGVITINEQDIPININYKV